MDESLKNIEVEINNRQYITSKADTKGKIVSVNSYFCEISGYSRKELIGKNHNVIRHPDMPRAIFRVMWEFLKKDKEFFAIIKNKTKCGKFYWVLANLQIAKENNKTTGYYSFRSKILNKELLVEIEELYSMLNEIEKSESVDMSIVYLKNYLVGKKVSYDTYIKSLIEKNTTPKKGLFESFFG